MRCEHVVYNNNIKYIHPCVRTFVRTGFFAEHSFNLGQRFPDVLQVRQVFLLLSRKNNCKKYKWKKINSKDWQFFVCLLRWCFVLGTIIYFTQITVCPRSSDSFYILTYYIKWVTASWIGSSTMLIMNASISTFSLFMNQSGVYYLILDCLSSLPRTVLRVSSMPPFAFSTSSCTLDLFFFLIEKRRLADQDSDINILFGLAGSA